MKTIILFITFFTTILGGSYMDVSTEVLDAIKQGNATAIAKNFNDKIDLKILDQEDVYSKAQAELVLKDFFAKHPVKSFVESHSSNAKSANQFVVGTLTSTNGKYRVSFLLKKFGERFLISQFRIENEND
ncbi:MAG: hypothetical protein K0S33_1380 [Bacteroidetes bacterium]|jgi:hypothetical protein|nr:hypothetical protein [Bacteroidota bacterium]